MTKSDAKLSADVEQALAKLTHGRIEGGRVMFTGGHISSLRISGGADQRATFTLVLDHVDVNQLSVILGLMKCPPVVDLTSLTMEPDGTSRADRSQAED